MMYQTGFPSSRDCISTIKGSCSVDWVQFLLMTGRNFKFLVWEPIFCLINWDPPGQVTHIATGAFSSLGETELQLLRPSKLHCFNKEFLCGFSIQSRFVCVCVKTVGCLGFYFFWYKLPIRGILELFMVCLPTVVPVCELPSLPCHLLGKWRYLSNSTKLFCQMAT